jgi:hypothetical protein
MSRPAISFMHLEQWILPAAQELSRRFAGWRNHYFGLEHTDPQFVCSNFDPQVLHYVWQSVETCVASPLEQSFEDLTLCLKNQLAAHPSLAWRARSERGGSEWNPLEQSFDDFSGQFADTETYVASSSVNPYPAAQFDNFFADCKLHG